MVHLKEPAKLVNILGTIWLCRSSCPVVWPSWQFIVYSINLELQARAKYASWLLWLMRHDAVWKGLSAMEEIAYRSENKVVRTSASHSTITCGCILANHKECCRVFGGCYRRLLENRYRPVVDAAAIKPLMHLLGMRKVESMDAVNGRHQNNDQVDLLHDRDS